MSRNFQVLGERTTMVRVGFIPVVHVRQEVIRGFMRLSFWLYKEIEK